MFAVCLTVEGVAWVAALAAPRHRRWAWRLAPVAVGILLAAGRRTATTWWRAAGVGDRSRSSSSSLGGSGRKAVALAAVLVRITLDRLDSDDRPVFARDDTPTMRYGPEVPGAGIHHDPTPPASAGPTSRTEVRWAAAVVDWLRSPLPVAARQPWVAVDGGYTKRESLEPAQRAGSAVVARRRTEAALPDPPPVLPPGRKGGRGRSPTSGRGRLSRAKRAGRRRGWPTVGARTSTGQIVTTRLKTSPATWRPAGGVVRVVVIGEEDGPWRACLGTAPAARVEALVRVALDRWGIEPNFHDLKGGGGIERVRLRRVWSDVGAWPLDLGVHPRIEVRSWGRSAGPLSDRSDRPWDDAGRRPSHAERRRAVQREMREEEFRQLGVPAACSEKIRHLLDGMVRMVA